MGRNYKLCILVRCLYLRQHWSECNVDYQQHEDHLYVSTATEICNTNTQQCEHSMNAAIIYAQFISVTERMAPSRRQCRAAWSQHGKTTPTQHSTTPTRSGQLLILTRLTSSSSSSSSRSPSELLRHSVTLAISDLHSVYSSIALASSWTLLNQTLRRRPGGLHQLAISFLSS